MSAFAEGDNQGSIDTTQDLGPQMRIVSWCMLCMSTVFITLRVYCKRLNGRGFWWDDYMLILSYLIFVVNVSMTEYNVRLGMGKHLSVVPLATFSRLVFMGNMSGFLSIFASIFSKVSFACTLLRVLSSPWNYVVYFCIVSISCTMTISAVFIWKSPAMDIVVTYGIFSAVWSGAVDILLALLPWHIIWGLQMRPQEKIGIGVAMSMGIFAGITAFVKASKIPSLASGDFTYYGAYLVIWAAAEVGTTIMAATIPILRVFVIRMKSQNNSEKRSKNTRQSTHGTLGNSHSMSNTASRAQEDEDELVSKRPGSENSMTAGSYEMEMDIRKHGAGGSSANDKHKQHASVDGCEERSVETMV